MPILKTKNSHFHIEHILILHQTHKTYSHEHNPITSWYKCHIFHHLALNPICSQNTNNNRAQFSSLYIKALNFTSHKQSSMLCSFLSSFNKEDAAAAAWCASQIVCRPFGWPLSLNVCVCIWCRVGCWAACGWDEVKFGEIVCAVRQSVRLWRVVN